jgi:2-iminobutanoate/2-iminopropanoate deaminase
MPNNTAKHAVVTEDAPAAIGPYSQAIVSDDLIFTSGQIPLDAQGTLVAGEIEDQVRQVMENLKAILHAAGATFDSVLKTTIYLRDLSDFARVNSVYEGYFGQCPPARSTLQVAALPRGASVEIDMIARR